MQPDPEELVEALAASLGSSGVDIVQPLALGWYNRSIPQELGACIPCGTAGQQALAMLVGNSRAVWEPFISACAEEDLLQHDNPLDVYLERAVCSSLAACAPGLAHRIYWSHRRTDELEGSGEGVSEHVAFQRMAHHAGLAYLDDASHLSLHPRFGPWFSLRCVVIFDDVPYAGPRPAELCNPLPAATQRYVRMALQTAVGNTSRKYHVPEVDVEAAEAVISEASIEPVLEGDEERPASSGGSTPACSSGASSGASSPRPGRGPALAPAGPAELVHSAANRLAALKLGAEPVATQTPSSPPASGSPGQHVGSMGSATSRRSSFDAEARPSIAAVARNWRAWVAVRDSPCPGHPMRYSEEQITYHYTRDRAVLTKALLRRGCTPRAAAGAPAAGLLDEALASYHAAALEAQRSAGVRRDFSAEAAAAAALVVTP